MPLNPMLYTALNRAFRGGVKIAKEGEQMRYRVQRDLITGKNKIIVQDDQRGEEYRVCCPFCGDSRYRLWISHKWGTTDSFNHIDFQHLINCFNDGCELNHETASPNRSDRVDDLRKLLSPLLRHTVSITVDAPIEQELKPELPRSVIALDQLEPTHAAVTYMRDVRKFDVARLSEQWNVMYCPDDGHPFVDKRIVIPAYYDSKLAGWQARATQDDLPKNIPKYFTMPGMRKNSMLYNYDRAATYKIGVIVEGAMDVWTVGFQGIASFGSTISAHQLKRIVDAWGKTGIILLADGDVVLTKEKLLRYNKMKVSLQGCAFPWGVLEVMLPTDKDPANFSSVQLWEAILASAKASNYDHPIFDQAAFTGACRQES